ncbi:MAG TPA: hypothetical protein G4N98_09995 [Thermoflexia bacterium]|nr:hypothetical protein [Thermoflexia bacterium]
MSHKNILTTFVLAIILTGGVTYNAVFAKFFEQGLVSTSANNTHIGAEIAISELDNSQYQPAVAYNWKHQEYLVVWENVWGGGGHDIYAQRVSDTGELKSWFYVPDDTTFTKHDRKQPAVAYDPVNDRYLVVWIYDTVGDGSNLDIHGRFVPWEGVDAGEKEFSINGWSSNQWEPKIAYGRTPEEFLVVWMNTPSGVSTYISAQRITAATGAKPDSAISVTSGAENRDNPDVAFNLAQNQYLITWDINNSGSGFDVYGRRLHGGSNNFAGGEIGIAGWPGNEENPRVAACSAMDKYLVAWQSAASGHDDVYVRFVNNDGSMEAPLLVGDTPANEQYPEVACTESGSIFMVVWNQQYSSTSGPYGVSGRFAYSDLTVSDDFAVRGVSVGGPNRWYPLIAGGYSNFLVTWEHLRSGTAYQDIHGVLATPYTVFLPLVIKN